MSTAAALHQSQLTWTGSVSLAAATAAPAAPAAVRAAEVAFIFSSSIYLVQKCRISSVVHVITRCKMRFLVLQYKWMRCSSEGGWHRINLISSCSSVDNIIRRSCTKTAKFKFATDRCSDQGGANQLLQNCCHPFRRVNKLYLLFRYDVKVWILSTTKLLWD